MLYELNIVKKCSKYVTLEYGEILMHAGILIGTCVNIGLRIEYLYVSVSVITNDIEKIHIKNDGYWNHLVF